MGKKARGDSKLDALPAAQFQELVAGIITGWTYETAREWCLVECGVCVSLSAFTPFYVRNVEPILKERKQFAALTAGTLAKLAKETEAFDAAAIGELKEYAYRLIRDPNSNPEDARKWMETLIKAQAQAASTEKFKASTKTKIEEGLEALYAEIAGNKKAEALFKQLQEVVSKA